jgi:outer membrane lipoprotein SlyB
MFNLSTYKKPLIIFFSFFLIFLTSCGTNPRYVSGEDAQKILDTQFGTVVDVQAVVIRGERSQIGATAGAIIGGLAGNLVDNGKFREILIAGGALFGGVVGYYAPVKLGEHNGFQYVVSIDGKNRPMTVIQGVDPKDKGYIVGQRVTIVFGEKIRMLPGKV